MLDRALDPAKTKRLICVCPRRRLFLRLNSAPLWPPQRKLFSREAPFLDYDSFVELRQLVRVAQADLARALRQPGNPLGRLTQERARDLAWSARRAETLSGEYQDLIWSALVTDWV